jgi:Restriction endonuclease BsobI
VYLAFGELKGGIDPAGADEHWKTARTALTRIQSAFATINLKPELFFVGAAIERKMATEIWSMLKDDLLSNAANLTNEFQLNSLARWLCNI